MDSKVFEKRIVALNDRPVNNFGECVIYWMQRSQRAYDNLALKFAIDRANELSRPLLVYFGLYDRYPLGSVRAFKFMLEGLKETAVTLADRGIGFLMRRELPAEGIVALARELGACQVVVDEDYLNLGRTWRASAAARLDVSFLQVDADTVVPARTMSKEEWGAYTLRPRITKALEELFFEVQESDVIHRWKLHLGDGIDLAAADPFELAKSLDVDQQVPPSPCFIGGAYEAGKRLSAFIRNRLPHYATERNDIGVEATSDMSPYLHFGQISPLRIALMVDNSDAPQECIDAYLEQLIVRRELAINFCLFNHNYNSIKAAPEWARKSLEAHRSDPRPEIYDLDELENAATHDDLWNAAQTELAVCGKIHNYLRMVWAKKMLEWSPTPEEALERAIYLNDKYGLDGRDPNGYANIAWCIYGKHDRPFSERPIFGKVRFMSTAATKTKTDWRAYIARISALRSQTRT